jgi:outer membrane immunogenic protein
VKKFIAVVTAIAAFGFVNAANAADMPTKAPMVPVAAPYNWTGFYVGGNIGYSWARSNDAFTFISAAGPVFDAGSSNANVNGVIGGLQAGYNWQTGALVLGLETDIQLSGQSGSGTAICPVTTCGGGGGTVTYTDKLTWFGTTRGRLGWAFDRWLVYGTGGVGYGTEKVSGSLNVAAPPAVAPFSGSSTRVGWAAGAGVEAALMANWTWRVEYLYLDLGTASFSQAAPSPPFIVGTVNQSLRLRDNIVRVGANYRF